MMESLIAAMWYAAEHESELARRSGIAPSLIGQFLFNRPSMFKPSDKPGMWKLTDEFRIKWTQALWKLEEAQKQLAKIWPEVATHRPNGVNRLVEVSAKIAKLSAEIKQMTTP